eukprot:9400944-Pyramimonas_sp.AAC.1
MDCAYSSNIFIPVYVDSPEDCKRHDAAGARGRWPDDGEAASVVPALFKDSGKTPEKVEDKENYNPNTGLHARQEQFMKLGAERGVAGVTGHSTSENNTHGRSQRKVLTPLKDVNQKPLREAGYAKGLGAAASKFGFDSKFGEVGGNKTYRYR